MSDHADIANGHQAKQALEVLNPAMDQVRDAIIGQLVKASPQDTARILALHGAVQSLEATRKAISQVVANGELAAAAVEGAFSPS